MTDEIRRAEGFASKLSQIYGDSLVAVVLYGSAARGEFRPGTSDLNLLVITRDLSLTELVRAGSVTREWVAEHNPPPLMLSEAEWRRSADVFPIEYSEIRDAHILLIGSDPFVDMRIRRSDLRLQVEHELRSKAIQLREGYLVSGEVPEELGKLLMLSLSTFLTLFRATLRLAAKPVPRQAGELVTAVAKQVGFAAGPVLEILAARQLKVAFVPAVNGEVAAGYLDAVERTVGWLDLYQLSGNPEEV